MNDRSLKLQLWHITNPLVFLLILLFLLLIYYYILISYTCLFGALTKLLAFQWFQSAQDTSILTICYVSRTTLCTDFMYFSIHPIKTVDMSAMFGGVVVSPTPRVHITSLPLFVCALETSEVSAYHCQDINIDIRPKMGLCMHYACDTMQYMQARVTYRKGRNG